MRLTIVFAACCALLAPLALAADNWPMWRGPNADGVVKEGAPPIEWSESKNIKWKVPVDGDGDSTPIVWGDKMIFQTAVPTKEDPGAPRTAEVPYNFNVVCYDRRDGSKLWETTVIETTPHEGHHAHGSYASYSPVTDGEHVWASFGSRGLYCLDLDGTVVWSKNLPELTTSNTFGEGSSPALLNDKIYVVADHEGDSKIFAFDKKTGDVVWEKSRDEVTTWATPYPVRVGDSYQIVTSGEKAIRSYDANTGDLIWTCEGLTTSAIPTPVSAFGKVYCTTGYMGYSLLAIELGNEGDLTDSDAIAWRLDEGTPYVSSPLIYEGNIYTFNMLRAMLSCHDADTGEPHYVKERLPELKNVYASPVAVNGYIYICDREGKTLILKAGDALEVVTINELETGFDASPVVIGDELYLKGYTHLYCIAEK